MLDCVKKAIPSIRYLSEVTGMPGGLEFWEHKTPSFTMALPVSDTPVVTPIPFEMGLAYALAHWESEAEDDMRIVVMQGLNVPMFWAVQGLNTLHTEDVAYDRKDRVSRMCARAVVLCAAVLTVRAR